VNERIAAGIIDKEAVMFATLPHPTRLLILALLVALALVALYALALAAGVPPFGLGGEPELPLQMSKRWG